MSSRFLTAVAVISVLAVASASAAADTTVIAGTGQSDTQAANSNQSDVNGASSGSVYIAGTYSNDGTLFIPGDAKPVAVQTAANVLGNTATIGGGPGGTTLIAPSASNCFCQASNQGANSDQEGSTDLQVIVDVVLSDQAIGGGPGNTTQIGAANQTNQQGVNASQNAGDTQNAFNILASAVIIGG